MEHSHTRIQPKTNKLTFKQSQTEVKDAGAKFIVSPGFDADVVKHCIDIDIPVCPGIMTPAELVKNTLA